MIAAACALVSAGFRVDHVVSRTFFVEKLGGWWASLFYSSLSGLIVLFRQEPLISVAIRFELMDAGRRERASCAKERVSVVERLRERWCIQDEYGHVSVSLAHLLLGPKVST